jgi:hypothetical protein
VVFGDGVERTRDTPEMRAFSRKLANEGMVLLRNEGAVLPIKPGTKVAVIGPNAKARVIAGGGSANLKASYVVSPWEGILNNKPDGVTVEYTVGCYGEFFLFLIYRVRPLSQLMFYLHSRSAQISTHTRREPYDGLREIGLALRLLQS